MTTKRLMCVFAAIVGLALCPKVARPQQTFSFTFTAIDVPITGATDTKAFDINARGDIVGRYFLTSSGPFGFLRYAGGTFKAPISVPVTNTGTVLRGIDDAEDVVGKYSDSNGNHGFLLTPWESFTSFDVPTTAPFNADADAGSTVANGINNPGTIVGFYLAPTTLAICSNRPSLPHGFLRDENGDFTPIDFPGADATIAYGVNEKGVIVGLYATVATSPAIVTCNNSNLATVEITLHGFLRTTAGQYLTVDASGAKNSIVTRINDAGDVVGDYTSDSLTVQKLFSDTETFVSQFIVRGNGNFTSFNVSIGGTTPLAEPLGINAKGEIVGVYLGAGSLVHGFLGTKQPW